LFAEGGEDVGGAAEMEDEGVVAGLLLLLLALGGRGGGEVGHGGGGEDEVGVGVLHRCAVEVVGADDVDADDALGGGEGDGPGEEDDLGAAAGGGLGEREAHRAGGAVGEEADGVEGLARGAGGDEDLLADERSVVRGPWSVVRGPWSPLG